MPSPCEMQSPEAGSADVFHGKNNSFAESVGSLCLRRKCTRLNTQIGEAASVHFWHTWTEKEIKPLKLHGRSLSHPIETWIDNVGFYHSFVMQLARKCCRSVFSVNVCVQKEQNRQGGGKVFFSENYSVLAKTWSCFTCCLMNIAKYLNYLAAVYTCISASQV